MHATYCSCLFHIQEQCTSPASGSEFAFLEGFWVNGGGFDRGTCVIVRRLISFVAWQGGQAISCPLRCLPLEVVANENMRKLVEINFPQPKASSDSVSRGRKAGPDTGEPGGHSVPRSRSSSVRSRGLVTDTLDLDNLPWHTYERGLQELYVPIPKAAYSVQLAKPPLFNFTKSRGLLTRARRCVCARQGRGA